MARINEIIDGKYEILREIGRGGMSVVYLAMDRRLNKQWAIKEFKKDDQDENNKVRLKALLDEANLMKKLDHPTLPRIVDIIEENKTVYIVMDYIEGESLNKVLEASGAQPQEAVIEWAKQLSDVLDYLHTQTPPVIYRDMKPANIMLKPDGTVRLIDFGIAREYKVGKAGDTEAIGTRGYAAPEQFGGKGQTDPRTDIYSFGVTLYHLVTGKNPAEPPYEIYPIRHWNPALSSGLEWLIQKCTQLNPNDRYQSFAEVMYVLDNLEKFEGTYKKKQKSRINAFITTVALAVIFSITSVSLLSGAYIQQENSYETYAQANTISGFERCIELNENKNEGYIGLVNTMREQISMICSSIPDGYTEETLPSNIMLQDEINTYFSEERLNIIKENDIEEYVSVCYELGRMYWNYYQGNSGMDIEATRYASDYFGKVIVAAQTTNDKQGGLTDQKYNLARAYYLVSYFQNSKSELGKQDDGEFKSNDIAKAANVYGISDDNTIENPYYSFWVTNKELLELIGGDEDISDAVKLESLNRLAYIINENYSDFYSQTKDKSEKVDEKEMRDFFDLFNSTLNNIKQTLDESQLNSIADSLNRTIKSVNGLYKSDIPEVKI